MQFSAVIFWGIIAYIIGSIPSSVWIGKSYFGKDIRDYGSGNAGATNTFRVLGTQAGIVVLLLDILKGVTAASLILYIPSVSHGTDQYVNLQLLFGILAVMGHIFPVFENFNGGFVFHGRQDDATPVILNASSAKTAFLPVCQRHSKSLGLHCLSWCV